jgi:hypothetical protein
MSEEEINKKIKELEDRIKQLESDVKNLQGSVSLLSFASYLFFSNMLKTMGKEEEKA